MGFYIRKALSVGPFRFNLSRSGIGISGGIRGLRLGTGPRGNYVHMGRHGLYFRRSLGVADSGSNNHEDVSPPETPATPIETVGMTDIESGSALHMVDSSAADLLAEMNSKRQRATILPWVIAVTVLLVAGVLWGGAPPLIVILTVVLGTAAIVLSSFRDQVAKTTVLLYDLEPEVEQAYQRLHDSFDAVAKAAAVWHVSAKGDVRDRRYHAGASQIVAKRSIRLDHGPLPGVRTNLQIPTLPVGRQLLAFMPDRLLIFDPDAVGAISYSDLSIQVEQTRFIESDTVPSDAKIIDHTWKYVNKSGSPDRRFRDNRQLPIAMYEDIHLQSLSGLNEVIQVSRVGVGQPLKTAVQGMAGAFTMGPTGSRSEQATTTAGDDQGRTDPSCG